MAMYFAKTDYDDVELGVGDLYAIPASEFDIGTYTETTDEETGEVTATYTPGTTVDEMDLIGYIEESATLTHEPETVEIKSANHGKVATIVSEWNTSFETGVISYDAEKVSKYLAGSTVATMDDGGTMEFFSNDAQAAAAALIFVCKDKKNGQKMELVMPRCYPTATYELEYTADSPVVLNYSFDCASSTLPNGEEGAFFRRKHYTTD